MTLTRVLRLRTAPCLRGGLRCLHKSHGSPRAVGHRDKERLSCKGVQQGSRVSKTRSRVTEVPARRVEKQHYYDLQTVRTGATTPHYNAAPRS
jgi:hypothetical protein